MHELKQLINFLPQPPVEARWSLVTKYLCVINSPFSHYNPKNDDISNEYFKESKEVDFVNVDVHLQSVISQIAQLNDDFLCTDSANIILCHE